MSFGKTTRIRSRSCWCVGRELVHSLLAGKADGAAEDAVDDRVDGTVEGWQVLDDHGRIETLLGVRKEVEIVQHVKQEVRAPTADESYGEESCQQHCGHT